MLIRSLLVAFALLAATACQKPAPEAPKVPDLVAPTDGSADAWKKYFGERASRYLKSEKKSGGHVYAYFLAQGADPAELLKTVQDTVDRGVLAGAVLAFGSPDSGAMADLLTKAFAQVHDKALAGVMVIFVGAAADKDRVQQAVAASGVEYVFLEAK
jgi:hypothetical protein